MVKNQIELKRLIKRNRKQKRRAYGLLNCEQIFKNEENISTFKIPFVVVRYWPDCLLNKQATVLPGKRLKLTSKRPFMCYDDLTILGKMKLFEAAKNESLIEMLGTIGENICVVFRRIQEQLMQFEDIYQISQQH